MTSGSIYDAFDEQAMNVMRVAVQLAMPPTVKVTDWLMAVARCGIVVLDEIPSAEPAGRRINGHRPAAVTSLEPDLERLFARAASPEGTGPISVVQVLSIIGNDRERNSAAKRETGCPRVPNPRGDGALKVDSTVPAADYRDDMDEILATWIAAYDSKDEVQLGELRTRAQQLALEFARHHSVESQPAS
ncbi:hypothetical protein Pan189_03720 [Stratiformator vulcanicus]|uniref:Uncharacterized protein n=2 Tax=Stratiformator vulcanicus TaxID=2527980 RepID=A0A517QWP7_9PLAN|nr:hypothetical protein Pan189_03720 [Stratiformator vulcanicus]